MEREEAQNVFKKLAASYPNWRVDATIGKSWVDDLEAEDAENVWANVNEYKRENKFPPTLADIVKPNASIEAKREKERTKERLLEKESKDASIPGIPPWERAGMSREDWMRAVIEKSRGEKG
ncbi:hypothetical protein [Paenibacillus sp. NPDC058177]|uniref:hypothetical protein n=1 Tax=Paenibacillus sp. NPDC058177 TaxID=3346369 RepID=UPI0036DBB676